ncbi:acyl-CoA dehydrogenase family protein [Virgibacillus sp.]|uniref:acyl-CoA dehydrogenase family protein n=1 Tax=Virgibacillus sp. TaxID=1872700 RepID=UPI0017BCDDAB|nr:acyl-CoA dehydrogenase family protein [Virgibacillus sp.]NWO12166.1 acyl-CoA dehydrogenase family protein [Virgibacillus sp.]
MEKVNFHDKDSIFPNKKWVLKKDSTNPFAEEEELLIGMIEKFVAEQVMPNLDKLEAHDYEVARELFRATGELGLLGAEVPEAYGGLEMGKRTAGIIAEKMGFGGSFSVSFNIHTGVGTLPFVYFGTEKQKARYLPKLVSGEWVGAYALTEPDAGSDALSAKTTAKKAVDGSGWTLNGEKQWITNAHIAQVYVVFANTSDGITAFVVERDQPGLSVGPEEKKLGIKGSSTATLILEDVRLEEEDILGEVGKGHKIALNILNLARLKLAFSNIGTSKQALRLAVEYGKERKQFKQPIIQFGMVQEKLANMALEIYGAESAAYYTVNRLDEMEQDNKGDILERLSNYAMACSINKVKASETLDYVIDEAVQIHGGYGYMQEYEVERIYRDARINRIFEGTNEINRLTTAKAFLKQYTKDSSVILSVEKEENIFIRYANQLLRTVLNALSETGELPQLDQFYLHRIALILEDIYLMQATEIKAMLEKDLLYINLADVFCEEAYQRVEKHTIVLLASISEENETYEERIREVRSLPVLYTNIIAKKQTIAKEMINRNGF